MINVSYKKRKKISRCTALFYIANYGQFLRATSGARNPNLNIGFKRMRGSYIALQ